MKHLLTVALLLAFICPLRAGESSLTITYQSLSGLGSGGMVIVPVACHDCYSHSGAPTAIGLVSARNVPPTNNAKEATGNLNIAHGCGLKFGCGPDDKEVSLNATAFEIPREFGFPREDILRASLECVRRCLPEKLRQAPVVLRAAEADKAWMTEIVREFNAHDRGKVFFIPPD